MTGAILKAWGRQREEVGKLDRREVGMGSEVLCTPCEGGPITMGRKHPGSLSCQIGMADCCVHSYLVIDKS